MTQPDPTGTAPRAPRELAAGDAPTGAHGAIHDWMVRYLRVPLVPPTLPEGRVGAAVSFRPAEAWLRYLKLSFKITIAAIVLVLGPFAVLAAVGMVRGGNPVLALVLGLLLVGFFVAASLWSWWSIQLRYDTTWYAMTDRALRVRTGIWIIREQTITFENVQNVRVRRGPLQRWIGIGDVTVETAASGVTDSDGTTTASGATIRGVDEPGEIRDRIVARMRESRSAGLGDTRGDDGRRAGSGEASSGPPVAGGSGAWSEAHLALLREVRDEARALAAHRRG